MLDAFFPPPTRDQVIALGGLFQACGLVDQYARLGTGNSADFETAMYSLMQQNPKNPESVYKSLSNLENGFELMAQLLGGKPGNQAIILRYTVGMLYLARKIRGNGKLMAKIGQGIDGANRQAEHFSLTHANVVANVADLYQNTVSTQKYRIQVQGVATNLQQQAIASRIRCLLFSAIRSAVLWQQLGGKRYHLVLRRRQIFESARKLETEAKTHSD
jgi:high frequency lysogenization protein